MKCIPLIIFITIVLSTAFQPVWADEESRTPPPGDPISVSEVVANWSAATDAIERVDVEFTRYVYDLPFETTTIAEGRLVCESGQRQFLSFRPGKVTNSKTRKKRSGKPFDVRLAGSERWVLDRDVVWEIDDDRKEARKVRFGLPVTRNHQVETSSWSDFLVRIIGINIPVRLATLGQIGGSYPYTESSFPVLNESFINRFTITILSDAPDSVFLHLVPRFPHDAAYFASIGVQLSRHTWLPNAIQIEDPAGTNVSVYVFRNRRINDCPERTQDLFNLDLTGYDIQAYDLDMPPATAKH